MTVIYPTVAGRPAAITWDGSNHRIDPESGEIDCPPERESAIADHLAERYGVDPKTILKGDEPPDEEVDGTIPTHTRDTLDLSELTYDELREMAAEADISGRSTMDKGELIDALEE